MTRDKFIDSARAWLRRSLALTLSPPLDVDASRSLLGATVGQTVEKLEVLEFNQDPIPWRGWVLTFKGGSTLGYIQPNDGTNAHVVFDYSTKG